MQRAAFALSVILAATVPSMAAAPIPLPSERREWVRVETPHFSIFSSAGPRLTRDIALDLERLTGLLIERSPWFRLSGKRTRIFLFGDSRDAQPYFDVVRGMRVEAAGITVRSPAGSTILIDCRARGGKTLTPRHELVHDLLGNNAQALPLWIEEGLAEYYSNRGRPIIEHSSRLRGRPRMPIAELFSVHATSPRSVSWEFYAQSWGAVAVLMRRDPAAFEQFLRDVAAGKSSEAALAERYGMTLKELENVIRRKAGRLASSIPAEKVRFDVTVQPMSRAALLSELGEMLRRLPNGAADAQRHHLAALEAQTRP